MRIWIVILASTLATACGGSNSAAPSSGTGGPIASPQPSPSTTAAVTGKAPAGAVVTLSPASGAAFPLPPGPAVMDQLGKAFVPEVLFVRVGQPVEFRNSEEMDHNVIVNRSRTGSSVFNAAPAPFEKYVHTFSDAGTYSVSCDIHPGMRATVVASTTPHTVLADQSGNFSFADIPPGPYIVSVMSPARDTQQPITVVAPRTDVKPLAP
jgi:plastocyanin